jgi:hypothetical protein
MINLDYRLSNNLIHIIDSYKINDIEEMKQFLLSIRAKHRSMSVFDRSIDNMIKEWVSHNILYKLHIFRSHTKDVDLEYPQKWFYKLGYSIIYKFKFLF